MTQRRRVALALLRKISSEIKDQNIRGVRQTAQGFQKCSACEQYSIPVLLTYSARKPGSYKLPCVLCKRPIGKHSAKRVTRCLKKLEGSKP